MRNDEKSMSALLNVSTSSIPENTLTDDLSKILTEE